MASRARKLYHLAGPLWKPGEPLLCWNRLRALGVEVEWKWRSPTGHDGDVVSLCETELEAESFQEEFGGTVLEVRLPSSEAWGEFDLGRYGWIRPRLVRVAEGYPAVLDGIPAAWLRPLGGYRPKAACS